MGLYTFLEHPAIATSWKTLCVLRIAAIEGVTHTTIATCAFGMYQLGEHFSVATSLLNLVLVLCCAGAAACRPPASHGRLTGLAPLPACSSACPLRSAYTGRGVHPVCSTSACEIPFHM